jgi:hypothetical protein
LSALLVTFGVLVAALLGALLWSSGRKRRPEHSAPIQDSFFPLPCQHLANLPQIKQAIERADLEYLKTRVSPAAANRLRRDRRRIVLAYLDGLREDFDCAVEATTRVAALSPQVEAKHEFQRLRLAFEFRVRYTLLRIKFGVGVPAFPGLSRLAWMVSSLAVELERAMNEVAAGAALAENGSRSAQS